MLTDLSFQVLDRAESPNQRKPFRYEFLDLALGRDDEMQQVIWEGDPEVYDSGKMLTVVYRRNEKEPDALENRLLDCEEDYEKQSIIWDVLDEILPTISSFYPTVTRITLETVEGKLTTPTTEDIDEIIPYPPIPHHLLHVPTVPIAELRKMASLAMDVDRVEWAGQSFAFKKTGEHVGGTLRELTILDKLRVSPRIINLEAIVVDRDSCVRGFLMPYMRLGNLQDAFLLAREKQGVTVDNDEPVFDWQLKLNWARQITQGVVDLHAIAAHNGDLKPQNVVLGPAGQAILIDFLPVGFSHEFAAPEMLEKHHDHDTKFESILAGPMDIYSLGLVLYAVAHEKADRIRPPVWRDGIPAWYRDVAQRCLALDPAARPTAAEVLSLLQQGAS